jgi:hypothetical protein
MNLVTVDRKTDAPTETYVYFEYFYRYISNQQQHYTPKE